MRNEPAIFLGAKAHDVNFGSNDDPNKLCLVGQKYEIEDVDYMRWYTTIKLYNIDGWFNSASFNIGEFNYGGIKEAKS